VVYAALNDVDILRQCIPGCESVEKTSDTEMTAKVTLKIGPVKASFSGKVTLSDLDPPNGYTITGEGSGGAAGFAKGGAAVKLESDGEATVLHYTVNAQIGGKLAQLGGRLIDATSKKLAGDFFEKFSEIVGPAAEGEPTEKKKGWLSKIIGSSAAVIIVGGLFVPTCCLNGHAHVTDDLPFTICSARS
jgi:carbon monoxide dehydrogenase subunit G